ncbi:MAG: hypothetical protein ACM3IL_05555 [Deltaproteobacteria bacterium]
MIRKRAKALAAVFFLLLIGGCETLKGTAEGMKRDASNGMAHLNRIDDWMRENLW